MLRRVAPYFYPNRIHCKERWFGRLVWDVLSTEFRAVPPDQHEISASENRITLIRRKGYSSDDPCSITGPAVLTSTVENGDILEYVQHYHEPPVVDFGASIEILADLSKILVVNKPPGLPTHPTGKYRKNSLSEIVATQVGYPVYPVYRLDRLTSGLIILAKSPSFVSDFKNRLSGDNVRKEYIARVLGDFGVGIQHTVEYPLFEIDASRSFEALITSVGRSKPCRTDIKGILYDPSTDTSLVMCSIYTGRTHQIRKHLALVGHPIVADTIYARKEFHQLSMDVYAKKQQGDLLKSFEAMKNVYMSSRLEKVLLENGTCPECQVETFRDPHPHELYIQLHALRYTVADNEVYTAPMPKWANA